MEQINELADNVMHAMTDESHEISVELNDYDKASFQGKYHKQSYRKAWEKLPDFKGWLKGVDGQPNRAFCSYCQVSLFAHRLSLLKHTCTLKHQRASQRAILKNSGLLQNAETMAHSSTQPEMHITTEDIKLNLHAVEVEQTLPDSMTVTIIQDGSDEPIELQLGQNIVDGENNTLMTDDDDLGLNTVQSVQLEEHMPQPVTLPPLKEKNMAHSSNFPLSTHVLDTSKGQPVGQLPVSLYRLVDSRWTLVNESVTNQDGRCSNLIQREEFVAGRYKLHFDTDRYFQLDRKETLYPFVEIAFDVHAPLEHYHIPLLLSAFGYSTYRGS
ncbi:5-hydroxyisourate hydrolase [Frankliniella fusca]|uniref:hydroxyisourate hydrolase n=1 Tax=Frankliniella fusca TaxID=407009 RepID=A0AAE1I3B5_9NEOP|nr:5-hydroxyisourate hydrolase [Frankliniella fusca]